MEQPEIYGAHTLSAQESYDPLRPVVVTVGGLEFETPLSEAINAAFSSAHELGDGEFSLIEVIEPAINTEAYRAHALTLVLLSETVDISVADLADELNYTPETLMRRTERGYTLREKRLHNMYEILELRYKRALRDNSQDAENPTHIHIPKGKKLNAEAIAELEAAQSGDSKAEDAVRLRFDEIAHQALDSIFPNEPAELDDAIAISNQVVSAAIASFDASQTETFIHNLEQQMQSQLEAFKSVAEVAKHLNVHSYIGELVVAENELAPEISKLNPKLDARTVETIIKGSLIYMVRKGHHSHRKVDGVPMSSVPLLTPKRLAEGGFENKLRKHLVTSGALREQEFFDFDLTMLPSQSLAKVIAIIESGKPTIRSVRAIQTSLREAGYVPAV